MSDPETFEKGLICACEAGLSANPDRRMATSLAFEPSDADGNGGEPGLSCFRESREKMVFTLVYCPECRVWYAAVPHPDGVVTWVFFEADGRIEHQSSHVSSGLMLCVKGHRLQIIADLMAATSTGAWVRLDGPTQLASAN